MYFKNRSNSAYYNTILGLREPNAANAVQYKIYSFLKANLTTKRRRSKMFSVRRNYANIAFICPFFSSL